MKSKIFMAMFLILCVGAIFYISGCAQAGHDKTVYYCPMHTAYTSDKPGNCPTCGMKLVEKKSEGNLSETCIEHVCKMKNCGMHVKTCLKQGEKIFCPICGEFITSANGKTVNAEKRKILYYRNPMNPEVTSDVPMKDSMGMDYVPVYNEGSGAPTVTISPEKQQLIGVKTGPAEKKNLSKNILASGRIAYDPDLVIAQQEFIQAINNNDTMAQPLIDASRSKLRLLGMSDDEITELEKTKKVETNLYLPKKGEDVWAYLSIYEYEIGLVKKDSSVEIESVAYPGEVFQGKIVSINPVLDPATRTNRVRAEILNPEDKLKPEMFISAKISAEFGEKLAVPETAVIDTGLRKVVYVSLEGGALESREVILGQKAEGFYEVLSGLKEGDIVVTSGNFLVDSESKLRNPGKK